MVTQAYRAFLLKITKTTQTENDFYLRAKTVMATIRLTVRKSNSGVVDDMGNVTLEEW